MEGDRLEILSWVRKSNFYPRPHLEGDPTQEEAVVEIRISTHALTWRATGINVSVQSEINNFYPRPHMEGDLPD